jgi:F420-dependent oxidoreductase-like protein
MHGWIGVAVTGGDGRGVLKRIQQAEEMGIHAAWVTTGGARQDGLTLLAAAAARTKRILLGTSITPIWPRHPVVVVQQARVIADLAPGRFRLGVGLSHGNSVESVFGLDYRAPLAHLRDYLRILKALLQQGKVDYDGSYYQAHAETGVRLDVPVMAAALRRRSFELCGAEADGAITWVCPRLYNKNVAVAALQRGAERAGRPVPPLIAHAPVCVHENPAEVWAAVREQMAIYPTLPNYARMFVDAGFPEAAVTKLWSQNMIDAVLLHGNESQVKKGLEEMFDWGAAEVIMSPILAGHDKEASLDRTMQLLADVSRTIGT